MLSTFINYRLIAKDLTASLARKAESPAIARETAYYEANIGKVKTPEDLLKDQRLYAYAMKAMGLEEMTYAKAFMRKVLTEGVADARSFANRLNDDRYKAFARAFDFAQGASANGAPKAAAQLSGILDLSGSFDFSGTNEMSFRLSSQVDATTTKSATIVLNKTTLAAVVGNLKLVTGTDLAKAITAQIDASGDANLKGKVQVSLGVEKTLFFETTAYANLGADDVPGGTGFAADTFYDREGQFRTLSIENVPLSGTGQTAIDIGFGTGLPPDVKAKSVTEAYLRQSLEDDAGAEDIGVRLALYFSRIAPTATNGFAILGDNALSQVVKTVLGLPDGASASALDRQAAIIEDRVDLDSFKDPVQLDRFIQKFTAIWDAKNNAVADPILALFGNGGASSSLDADLLLSVQRNRSGG